MFKKIKSLNDLLDVPTKFAAAWAVVWPLLSRVLNYDRTLSMRLSVGVGIIGGIVFLTLFLPRLRQSGKAKYWAARAPVLWEEIKECLSTYPRDEQPLRAVLEKKYKFARLHLMEVVAANKAKLLSQISLERPGAAQYGPIVLRNFESFFAHSDVQRTIIECQFMQQIDSFDRYPFMLKNL